MSSEFPAFGRLAGIDYGSVRIGVAITDPGRRIATPHDNYTRRNSELDRQYFRRLVEEYGIVAFVIGLPIHVSGNESQKSLETRDFAKWLGEMTTLPYCFCDERYSTKYAESLLAVGEFTSGKRKKRLDKLAAQVILAAYLERSATPPEVENKTFGRLDD